MRAYPDELPIEPLDRPVQAVVRPPGSKSLTNRALVVAALAVGPSRLHGGLEADDSEAMREGLRRLGVVIEDDGDPWVVRGTGGDLVAPAGSIDARGSGTTARFLTAVAALVRGRVVIDGNARLRERPIGELVSALQALGVDVSDRGGYPPVVVVGRGIGGGEVEVDARRSSQFVSALLMVSPLAHSPVRLRLKGGELVSRPYVGSTLEVMRSFGALATEQPGGFQVEPRGYRGVSYEIESDASAAAYPFVAAAITGGKVVVEGIPAESRQPDLALVEVLEQMGCTLRREGRQLELTGPKGALQGVDVDLNAAPDAVLALSVAALFAEGETTIRNIANLRLKESDRIAALEVELAKLGANVQVAGDSLIIRPGPLRPATVATYQDHRMAMALALVGLRLPGVVVADPGCVRKTWPGYFEMLAAL
jgi:3-phosphoshikimate 1-carboxyvinyltransferase